MSIDGISGMFRGEQHGRMQQVEFERMRATENKQNGVHHEIFNV